MSHRSLTTLAAVLAATSYAVAENASSPDFDEIFAGLGTRMAFSPSELAFMNREPDAASTLRRKAPPATPASATVTRPDSDIHTALLLRDAYSTIAFITGGSEVSQNGASFSVTNDQTASSTTLAGNGALIYAIYGDTSRNIPGDANVAMPRVTHFSVVPGLEWDFKSKNGQNSGSVSGRFGTELELVQGGPITLQYITANAIYTTDVATNNAQVYGTEISWQPKAANYWIGTSRRVNQGLDMWFAFHPTLDVDYYHVGQTGSFANLTPNIDYLWVGPKAQADLYFLSGPLQPIHLYAKYFYLYDALNGAKSTVSYLQTGVKYKIASWGADQAPATRASLTVDLRYTNGTTPRTLDRVDELYAGLTLKLGDISN